MDPAIVVTGAASGIGRELALAAAHEQCLLLLVDRSREPLADLVQELVGKGVRAVELCIDLIDPRAVARVESALSEQNSYCDVLVNCAGFGTFGAAIDVPARDQLDLIDCNVRALTALTLHFLPGMVARGRGGVLNVGSISGYVPGPYMAVYYASKAYVNSFTAALAAEVAGTNVTVTCLAPGVVRTNFFARCPVGQMRMLKLMPRSSAADTAAVAWKAFRAGKRHLIPRFLNRTIIGVFRLLPTRIAVGIIGALQRPA
jgi:hypothetical protein